jgi:hypothetical protein
VNEIVEGIKHGVRKVNIDTDLRMASTGAVRKHLIENTANFDPQKFIKKQQSIFFAGVMNFLIFLVVITLYYKLLIIKIFAHNIYQKQIKYHVFNAVTNSELTELVPEFTMSLICIVPFTESVYI